jgi:hypothetical protein
MKIKKCLILLLIFWMNYSNSDKNLIAQNRIFNLAIPLGLNFSELEGNEITDYYGLNTGIMGIAKFSKHGQVGMEMLFSQNGEYILPGYYPPLQYGKVRLNHVELPIHVDWLIGVFQRDKFYDLNLNIGIAYTRIFSHHIEDLDKNDVSSQIIYENKEAMLLQAGMFYRFSEHLGMNLKASLPMRIDGLSWTLAARMIYYL